MWIEREKSEQRFVSLMRDLNREVIILQGARQVGKTSFVEDLLDKHYKDRAILRVNLFYADKITLNNKVYYGKEIFDKDRSGVRFLRNIELILKQQEEGKVKNAIVFIDEVDRYPQVIDAVQTLAESGHSFILTGSNLENISESNASTGRKKYFDLYPVTFTEFLRASGEYSVLDQINSFSVKKPSVTEYIHEKAIALVELYTRLGGMPKVLTSYLKDPDNTQAVSSVIVGLVSSIEENVKLILGEQRKHYEYSDILRTLAKQSMNTLKFSRLQVTHASRAEAKKVVNKTVGAGVAHKIRLWNSERDLSKYIVFDSGVCNYLLAGSSLLENRLVEQDLAILWETYVGNSLIASISSRDDLLYWKSGNKAEIEFALRSPKFIGIDVKSKSGNLRSLNSMALLEKELDVLVKISSNSFTLHKNYVAKLATSSQQRKIPLLNIPFYLVSELDKLLREL